MTESTLVETLIGQLESLEDRSWWFHTALKFERQFAEPPFHITAVDQQLFLTVTCPLDGEQEQLQIGRVVSHSYGWPFPITSEQKAIFARELTGNPSLKVGDTFRMSMQGLLGRRRQLIENLKHWVRVHDNDQKRKLGHPQNAPTGPSPVDRSEILKRLRTLIECLTKTVEMSRFFPPEGELVSSESAYQYSKQWPPYHYWYQEAIKELLGFGFDVPDHWIVLDLELELILRFEGGGSIPTGSVKVSGYSGLTTSSPGMPPETTRQVEHLERWESLTSEIRAIRLKIENFRTGSKKRWSPNADQVHLAKKAIEISAGEANKINVSANILRFIYGDDHSDPTCRKIAAEFNSELSIDPNNLKSDRAIARLVIGENTSDLEKKVISKLNNLVRFENKKRKEASLPLRKR